MQRNEKKRLARIRRRCRLVVRCELASEVSEETEGVAIIDRLLMGNMRVGSFYVAEVKFANRARCVKGNVATVSGASCVTKCFWVEP